MACLSYWPLRQAWADHLAHSTGADTIAQGARLSPGDADIRLKLASAQQAAGADDTQALEAAAALDPLNADALTRLGLDAEMHGNLPTAERRLLEAADVSRQFAPRWALANYYFRRGDQVHFWPWAQEALTIGHGDLNPVFWLCWNMSQDAGLIFARAIPERALVLNQYLGFLLAEDRLPASVQPAAKLAALATPGDQKALLDWCNRELDAGAVAPALQIWNTLCARRLLPYAPIDRDRAPLTDGGFRSAPLGGGFAWRLTQLQGVTLGRNRSPQYLWVSFSGDQPENCVPLVQFVPVTPGAAYSLSYDYQTSELPAASGLRWSVFDGCTETDLANGSPWLSSPDWKHAEVRFAAPAGGLVRLALSSQRLAGAVRIDGTLELRDVSMERR
jgi:hypothetical protein